ncbi:hypothetical protein PG999_006574 [Apiospora kogelbergensis]|uniref:Uncharacterized protein n=1 Tax=Apiospora kogelbergensis TaxID=1337665 RepID=A0AAW0QR58_9PEZI
MRPSTVVKCAAASASANGGLSESGPPRSEGCPLGSSRVTVLACTENQIMILDEAFGNRTDVGVANPL